MMTGKADGLWNGVEKATQKAKDTGRLFINGFIGDGACNECGGRLSETTANTEAGLARVEVCDSCDRMFFVELYEPRVREV